MDRRRETRIETDQEVQVTLLSEPHRRVLPARVVDLSGRGLRLVVKESVPRDAALKIEMADQLLLGEVAYSQEKDGEWHLGVQVEHSLTHLRDLERLRRSLLEADLAYGEEEPAQVPVRVNTRKA